MWKSELKIHELIVYKGSDNDPLYVKHFRLDNIDNLHHPKIQECLSLIKTTFSTPINNWKKVFSIQDKRFKDSFFDDVYSEGKYLIPLNETQKSEHLLYAPFAGKKVISQQGSANKEVIYLSYESYIYPVFVTEYEQLFAHAIQLPKTGNKYENVSDQLLGLDKKETLDPFTKGIDYFEIEFTKNENEVKSEISTSYKGLNGLFPKQNRRETEEAYNKRKAVYLNGLHTKNKITFKKMYLFTGIALIELYKRAKKINEIYDYSFRQNKGNYFHKFLLSTQNDTPFYDLKGVDKQVHIFVVHDKNRSVKGISMIMNKEALRVFEGNIQGQQMPENDEWNVIVFEHDKSKITNGIDFDSKMYESGIVHYDDKIENERNVQNLLKNLHSRVAEGVSNHHIPVFRFTSHPIVQYDMSKVIWLLCNELKITNEDIVCKMNGMKNLEVFCKNNGILVLMLTSKYSTPDDLDHKIEQSETRVHSHHPSFQITKSSGLKSLDPWKIVERENGRRYQNINKKELYDKLNEHHDAQDVLLIFSDRRILKYGDDKFLWTKNILKRYL